VRNNEIVVYESHGMMEVSIMESKYDSHESKCVKQGSTALEKTNIAQLLVYRLTVRYASPDDSDKIKKGWEQVAPGDRVSSVRR